MKNNHWLMVAVSLLLGLLACRSVSPSSPSAIQTAITQTQTAQPTDLPTPTPTPALFYYEDFSEATSGWQTGEEIGDPDGRFDYVGGEYLISRLGGQEIVTWAFARQDFYDGVLSVDFRQVSGDPVTTSAGIFWRIAPDYSGYYKLFISGDGQFTVSKFTKNTDTVLNNWETNSAILRGKKVNHVDIYFVDDVSVIFINYERVAVFNDSASLHGDIALGAASSKTSGAEIAFDNVAVHSYDWVPSDPNQPQTTDS